MGNATSSSKFGPSDKFFVAVIRSWVNDWKIPSLNTCDDDSTLCYLLYRQTPVVAAVIQLKIHGNTESQEEVSDKTHACVMPLPNNDGEYNEFNLVAYNKIDTTTTTFTTHITMEELQRGYYTVNKAEKLIWSKVWDDATRGYFSCQQHINQGFPRHFWWENWGRREYSYNNRSQEEREWADPKTKGKLGWKDLQANM